MRAEEQRRSHRGASGRVIVPTLRTRGQSLVSRRTQPRRLRAAPQHARAFGSTEANATCDNPAAHQLCDGDRLKAPLRTTRPSQRRAARRRRTWPRSSHGGGRLTTFRRAARQRDGAQCVIWLRLLVRRTPPHLRVRRASYSRMSAQHMADRSPGAIQRDAVAVFAFGIDDNGNAIMDGRSGMASLYPQQARCRRTASWSSPAPVGLCGRRCRHRRLGVLTKDRSDHMVLSGRMECRT